MYVYMAHSKNINFECDPQIGKGWARLTYIMKGYELIYIYILTKGAKRHFEGFRIVTY